MSVVYVESSAVLAWLLGEPGQQAIVDELASAEHVVTSALTVVECSRALLRARLSNRVSASDELAALRLLDDAARSWNVLDISDGVTERARGEFPLEPVRTLDALHLASALEFSEALGPLRMLSLDDRVRTNARTLGMTLFPQ